jgi:hypothetical protein
MKFNPRTQRLFTNEGRLIKRMHCPLRIDWAKLEMTSDPASRRCGICQHKVSDLDTDPLLNKFAGCSDLIEDFVGASWNQGDIYRLDSCEGVWDGSDLVIQYESTKHRSDFVG